MIGSRQSMQIFRINRWARIRMTEEEIKKGSIPMSINRVMVPGASLV